MSLEFMSLILRAAIYFTTLLTVAPIYWPQMNGWSINHYTKRPFQTGSLIKVRNEDIELVNSIHRPI